MSSDEDGDIGRLRSDLIKSIRSKKSSRVESNTSSNSSSLAPTIKNKADVKMGSAILDTDIDDLDALRRAALVTLKKTKETSLDQVGAMPAESRSMPITLPFPPGTSAPFGQYPYYSLPPVLLGPTSSFSQFPAPPPAYQSRFFSHPAPPFRQLLQPMRSNLIVISTVPRAEDQLRPSQPSTSTFSSGKLVLPQDRYSKRADEPGSGHTEKRKHDKWSRFNDSRSTSSSSSSNSVVSSDNESDEEVEAEEPSKMSDDASTGTPLEAEGDGKDDSESTRDTPFEGVVIDESISEQQSEDDAATADSTPDLAEVGGELSETQSPDSSPPRQPSEDDLLDEPEVEIEFLDEPVDEAIVQQLMVDSPLISEARSTPEPSHRHLEEQVTESPNSKDSKKHQLQSKYDTVKQQLENLHHHKEKAGSSYRSSDGEDRKRSERHSRHDKYRSPSKNVVDESSRRSRRDEEERHYHRRPPAHKQLSSVVAMSSHGIGHQRRSDAKRGVSSDYDEDEKKFVQGNKAKRLRGHAFDNDGSSHRSARTTDVVETVPILPSAGEDLRKFLEKRKGSGTISKSGDSGTKFDLPPDGSTSARPSGKVISLKRSIVSTVIASYSSSDNDDKRGRSNGTGGSDLTTSSPPKLSVKDRISLPRDRVSKPKESFFTKITDSPIEIDPRGWNDTSAGAARPVGRWRNSGATSREGTNSTGIGKKVKLRKRPY